MLVKKNGRKVFFLEPFLNFCKTLFSWKRVKNNLKLQKRLSLKLDNLFSETLLGKEKVENFLNRLKRKPKSKE